MKVLLSVLIAAVVLLAAFATQAQVYSPQSVTLGSTIVVGSTATNGTAASVLDVRKQKDVTVQFKFYTHAAGTDPVLAYLAPSVDGVTYDTTRKYAVGAPAVAAGTAVCLTTNIDCSGYGYLKVLYVTNAGGGSVNATNISLKYAIKRGAS